MGHTVKNEAEQNNANSKQNLNLENNPNDEFSGIAISDEDLEADDQKNKLAGKFVRKNRKTNATPEEKKRSKRKKIIVRYFRSSRTACHHLCCSFHTLGGTQSAGCARKPRGRDY